MRGTGLIYAYRKGEGVGLRQKFGKEGRRERGSLETFVDENFPNVYNIHNPNQNMDIYIHITAELCKYGILDE